MYRLPTHCSMCQFQGVDFHYVEKIDYEDLRDEDFALNIPKYCFLFDKEIPINGRVMECKTDATVEVRRIR